MFHALVSSPKSANFQLCDLGKFFNVSRPVSSSKMIIMAV